LARNTRLLLLGCLLGAMLAAACSGDDVKPSTSATATQQSGASTNSATPKTQTAKVTAAPGDGSGGLVDACTLLTKADITEVIGEGGDGQVTNDPPTSTCFWFSTTADGLIARVEVVLYTKSNAQDVADYYAGFTGDPVDGIGEKAKWVGSITTLEVLQGNYDLQLSVARPIDKTPADQLNASKALAQKALARLP